jgi:DNA-binding transcriptional regulator GbsR (MarR family)
MRKKPKLKPSSEAFKVLNLIKADANTSVKELVEKTGLSKTQVYSARHYLKKNGLLKTLPMTGIAPKLDNIQPPIASKVVQKAVVKMNRDIEMRDQKITALQSELNRVRHMYMDQLAIVRYLEVKLMQFVESNLKGN